MSERVGVLLAASGQYEEYRARQCEVYESVDAARAEARRRNALVVTAREKLEINWNDEDEAWERAEKRRKRVLAKLRREAADPDIEPHDVNDLTYIVTEARLVR